jgi:hypothetical protein
MRVVRITGQSPAGFRRLSAANQDGNAVPAFLPLKGWEAAHLAGIPFFSNLIFDRQAG